jgi:hypothetical protein
MNMVKGSPTLTVASKDYRCCWRGVTMIDSLCQDPYFHTLTNGRQRNVSLILLCSSGLALGLRPLLSSPARAILTGIQNVSAALPFVLVFGSLVSLSVVLWYSVEACWMVVGPGDLIHSTDESSV